MAYKNFLKRPSDEHHLELKAARRELLREKRKAKCEWQYHFAEKVKYPTLKSIQEKHGIWYSS